MDYLSLILLAETCEIYNRSHSWNTGYICYFHNSTEFNTFCGIMKEAKGIKFDYHISSMSVWFDLE
jgi:hypothetical protein